MLHPQSINSHPAGRQACHCKVGTLGQWVLRRHHTLLQSQVDDVVEMWLEWHVLVRVSLVG